MDRYHPTSPSQYNKGSFVISALDYLQTRLYRVRRDLKFQYFEGQAFVADALSNPREARHALLRYLRSRFASIQNALIVIWIIVLCWGEIWAFDTSIDRCDWRKWEQWPSDADPHHIAFVADPQIVDPHTYPGRSWPLSSLTIKHTDLYMRRAYSRILQKLDPHTVLFIGDLFDGGREWATATSHSPERRYQQYNEDFWLSEFERFSDIFFQEWKQDFNDERKRRDGRRIIASLPGNHDLGFGRGIQKPVRDRFSMFFGEVNRLDVIGNHTFVSVDTPSLSAIEQFAAEHYKEIWKPTQDFLLGFQKHRAKAVTQHLYHLQGNEYAQSLNEHRVDDVEKLNITREEDANLEATANGFPTVLLTHIPLMRMRGEPCGPFRERYPPVPPAPGKTEPFKPDDPNSIDISAGYQYQNVLSQQLSEYITKNLAGSVEYVFSGDDHDYCEVVHTNYENPGRGIKEITIKSISEAMGVRKPGFVLASLWNPIDASGKRTGPSSADPSLRTLQSQLCLLPDEIGIVLKYLLLIILSLAILFVRAVNLNFRPSASGPVFVPSTSKSSAEKEKTSMNGPSQRSPSQSERSAMPTASASSSSDDSASHLSSRTPHPSRAKSSSPLPSYRQDVASDASRDTWAARHPHLQHDNMASVAYTKGKSHGRRRPQGPLASVLLDWIYSIWYVARVVVFVYIALFNWF